MMKMFTLGPGSGIKFHGRPEVQRQAQPCNHRECFDAGPSLPEESVSLNTSELHAIKLERKALDGYRGAAYKISVLGSMVGPLGPALVELDSLYVRPEGNAMARLKAEQPRNEKGQFDTKDKLQNPITDVSILMAPGMEVQSGDFVAGRGPVEFSDYTDQVLQGLPGTGGRYVITPGRGRRPIAMSQSQNGIGVLLNEQEKMGFAKDVARQLLEDPNTTLDSAVERMQKVGEGLLTDAYVTDDIIGGPYGEMSSEKGDKRYILRDGKPEAREHNGRIWVETHITRGETEALKKELGKAGIL